MNDGINVIVVDQVLTDLGFRATSIEHAGKLDDGRRTIDRQPTKNVQGKSEVCLAFGGKYAGGGETRVVDQQWVGVTVPFDGIGWIGDDGFERFVIPMSWIGQGVAVGDVEFLKIHIVQKHVDATQVVGGEIDFLTIEALAHRVAS
ncbi:hypothetical protein D3C85_1358900 [compost metagenome]